MERKEHEATAESIMKKKPRAIIWLHLAARIMAPAPFILHFHLSFVPPLRLNLWPVEQERKRSKLRLEREIGSMVQQSRTAKVIPMSINDSWRLDGWSQRTCYIMYPITFGSRIFGSLRLFICNYSPLYPWLWRDPWWCNVRTIKS